MRDQELGEKEETYRRVEMGLSLWSPQSRREGERQTQDLARCQTWYRWTCRSCDFGEDEGSRLPGTITECFPANLTLDLTFHDELKVEKQTRAFQRERKARAKTRSTQAVLGKGSYFIMKEASVWATMQQRCRMYWLTRAQPSGEARIQFYKHK